MLFLFRNYRMPSLALGFIALVFVACKSNNDNTNNQTANNSEQQTVAPNPNKMTNAAQIPDTNKKYKLHWLPPTYDDADIIANRIAPPNGYERLPIKSWTFGDFARHLPLGEVGTTALKYDNTPMPNQKNYAAILNIEVGIKDLQKSAQSIIRLWAEYLYHVNRMGQAVFHVNNGYPLDFARYMDGYRPQIDPAGITWTLNADPNDTYGTYKMYLVLIFQNTDLEALNEDLGPAPGSYNDIAPGDVFISFGNQQDGHAAIVIDVAQDKTSGEKLFLLAQGGTPAQSFNIPSNPADPSISPWYKANYGSSFKTPMATFYPAQRKRFKVQ
jgi:hypothetical protein